jgi:peptidylprolyl isomerase
MPQFSFPRVLALGAVVALVGAGLATAVVVGVNAQDDCVYPVGPGKASALVNVADSAEGLPVASFPTPLITTGRELTILEVGEGEGAKPGGYVDFDVSVFVGADQEYLIASSYQKFAPVRRALTVDREEFFGALLECQRPGARVVITTTVEDALGPIEDDEYLQSDSTVVLVADVHETYPSGATGDARRPQSGLPTLVQAPTGEHGFSFPNAEIPEDLRISVLKMGDGAVVKEGDFMTALFTGVVWNTRTVFVSSFDQGIPLSLVVKDVTTSLDGQGVIPGLATALIGQTIGSQVLVSVPPSEGYALGTAPAGVPPGATLVYVFDILGVTN